MVLMNLLLTGMLAAQPVTPETVTLPLKDYLSLRDRIEQMSKLPMIEIPPRQTRMTNVHYRFIPCEEIFRVESTYQIMVAGGPCNEFVLPQPGIPYSISEESSMDCGFFINSGNQPVFAAKKPGIYTTAVESLIPFQHDEGRIQAGFTTPDATSIKLMLEVDRKWKCDVPGSVELSRSDDYVILSLPPKSSIHLSIEPLVRKKIEEGDFWVETVTMVFPIEKKLMTFTFVSIQLLEGSLDSVNVASGNTILIEKIIFKDHEIPVSSGEKEVNVNLPRGERLFVIQGQLQDDVIEPPVIRNSRYQQDYIAFSPNGLSEFSVSESGSWKRIDNSELPGFLSHSYPYGVHLAHQQTGDGSFTFISEFHRPSPVLKTVITSREVTLVRMIGGRELHLEKIIVQNPGINFNLPLPEGFELQSVRIDGKPSKGHVIDSRLVVPVGVRSEKQAANIEILYLKEKSEWEKRGHEIFTLPLLFQPVIRETVTLILPEQYSFRLTDTNGTFSLEPMREWVVKVESSGMDYRAALAEQKGSMYGQVVDTNGVPLPGVFIQVESSSFTAGPKVTVTDESGNFRYPYLPTDQYKITFNLDGFQPLVHDQVIVKSDKATRINTVLTNAHEFTEEIVVTGQAPVVDATQTSIGDVYEGEILGSSSGRRRPGSGTRTKKEKEAPEVGKMTVPLKSMVEGVKGLSVNLPTRGKVIYFERLFPNRTPFKAEYEYKHSKK